MNQRFLEYENIAANVRLSPEIADALRKFAIGAASLEATDQPMPPDVRTIHSVEEATVKSTQQS